jgi:3-methyladenine DNA glycosylase Tag
MAKKKLTEEQESEIKTLLENNKMLENTKKQASERGNAQAVKQIERAQ